MELDAVERRLAGEKTVPGLLAAAARLLVDVTGAFACDVSRLAGELIVEIAEFSRDGRSIVLGYGYLLSDFPLTKEVVETSELRTVSVHDEDADPSEAALLGELGFDSLLMVPLERGGESWGLVELFDRGERRFGEAEAELARRIVQRTGELLERLDPPEPRVA